MLLRIVSDGTCEGTRVEDATTREPLLCVTAVSWKIDTDSGLAKADITLSGVPVSVVGNYEGPPL